MMLKASLLLLIFANVSVKAEITSWAAFGNSEISNDNLNFHHQQKAGQVMPIPMIIFTL